jgi:iron complex outermembrane receptor protein
VQGLELDVTAQPARGLQLFGNATFLGGKYLDFVPGSAAANAQAQFGDAKPPQLPPYVFTLGFNYDQDLKIGSGKGRVSVGGDWYRSGRYLTDATNASIVDPYSRVNGYVAFSPSEPWELRASVKNLLNRTTVVSGTPALGSYIVLPPREYMLTIRYRM